MARVVRIPSRALPAALSLGVLLLPMLLLLLDGAAEQTTRSASGAGEDSNDEAKRSDEHRPPPNERAQVDIREEIREIDKALSHLEELLQSATKEDATNTLKNIRDELERMANHLAPPISVRGIPVGTPTGTPGGTAGDQVLIDIRDALKSIATVLSEPPELTIKADDMHIKQHLESVSEDVLKSIGQVLESLDVTVSVQGEETGRGCRIEQLTPLVEFPEAEHIPMDANCQNVAAEFLDQVGDRGLSHLVLVGRADRVPFADPRYGGNRGLAQARARWVHECLRRELPNRAAGPEHLREVFDVLENRTMLLSAGPLHVPACWAGKDCDPEVRQRDRSVDLFACLEDT